MKIFAGDYINEDVLEQMKKEEHIYYSSKLRWFISTDLVYSALLTKFNIKTDEDKDITDEDNYIEAVYTDIEDFLDTIYDGEYASYFGAEIYLPNYTELVKLSTEDCIDEETGIIVFNDGCDWGEELDSILKQEVSIGLQIRLTEELENIKLKGYSIDILKDAFEMMGN